MLNLNRGKIVVTRGQRKRVHGQVKTFDHKPLGVAGGCPNKRERKEKKKSNRKEVHLCHELI